MTTAAVEPATAIVRFLIARIDDDEAQARRLSRANRTSPAASGAAARNVSESQQMRSQCLARRKVLGIAQQMLVFNDLPSQSDCREYARQLLRAIAAPYSTHPGFPAGWA